MHTFVCFLLMMSKGAKGHGVQRMVILQEPQQEPNQEPKHEPSKEPPQEPQTGTITGTTAGATTGTKNTGTTKWNHKEPQTEPQ